MLIPPYGADVSESRLSSQVDASSPGVGDQLDQSTGLSGAAWAGAVGACGQSNSARGIDGNQLNDALVEAGAAWLI